MTVRVPRRGRSKTSVTYARLGNPVDDRQNPMLTLVRGVAGEFAMELGMAQKMTDETTAQHLCTLLFQPPLQGGQVGRHLLTSLGMHKKRHQPFANAVAGEVDRDSQL